MKRAKGYPALTIDSTAMRMADAIIGWPTIDFKSPEQVEQRIRDYFQVCTDCGVRPGVVGLSAALGIDRRRLWDIRTGNNHLTDVPTDIRDLIKKAYATIETLWEYQMQAGKIDPVAGIFLGKNQFGYKDTSEYTITPKVATDTLPSEELQRRIDTLPDA